MKSSKLLNLLTKYAKQRVKICKENDLVIKPIGKKYLPSNSQLRSWYNQAYYCFHYGMPDACVSLIFIILERMSRDMYGVVVSNPKKEKDISWYDVLKEIHTHSKSDKERKTIQAIMDMRERGQRNKHQHGEVNAILGRYNLRGIKINLKSREQEKVFIPANAKMLPHQIQTKIKGDITEMLAASLMYNLTEIVKCLSKYSKKVSDI